MGRLVNVKCKCGRIWKVDCETGEVYETSKNPKIDEVLRDAIEAV